MTNNLSGALITFPFEHLRLINCNLHTRRIEKENQLYDDDGYNGDQNDSPINSASCNSQDAPSMDPEDSNVLGIPQ